MDKYTGEYLDGQLDRELRDANSNTFSDLLRVDAVNDAIDYLQHILAKIHRRGFTAIEWPKQLLQFENFSYKNQISLDSDYYLWVELRKADSSDMVRIVPVDKIQAAADKPWACIFGMNISPPVPDSDNEGTDDFEVDGNFSGSAEANYIVEVQSGTTFRWSDDGGSGYTSGVTITGDWQTLNNGVKVKFASTSGYTATDKWTFTAYHDAVVSILRCNFDPSVDLRLTFVRKHSLISTSLSATDFLPYPRFYSLLKLITKTILRSYRDEKVDVEYMVNNVALKKAKEIIRELNGPELLTVRPGKTYNDYR